MHIDWLITCVFLGFIWFYLVCIWCYIVLISSCMVFMWTAWKRKEGKPDRYLSVNTSCMVFKWFYKGFVWFDYGLHMILYGMFCDFIWFSCDFCHDYHMILYSLILFSMISIWLPLKLLLSTCSLFSLLSLSSLSLFWRLAERAQLAQSQRMWALTWSSSPPQTTIHQIAILSGPENLEFWQNIKLMKYVRKPV